MIKVPFDDAGVRELVLHLGFDGSGHIGGRDVCETGCDEGGADDW